jgi:DNA modification methylase
MTDLIVVKVDKARLLLAEARNATDAKKVMDLANAAEIYAKRARLGEESIKYAHAIKIDAETLLGKFLAAAPKNKGGNLATLKQRPTGSSRAPIGTLDSLHITKKKSVESQMLAKVADENPKLHRAIVNGEKTVSEARRALRRKAQAEQEAQAVKGISGTRLWTLTAEQAIIPCALLLTDPPYGILDEPWEPAELKKFTLEWGHRWNDCGAEMLAVFWSQQFLFEGREWFDKAFSGYAFHQLLVWHYPNNNSPQSRMGFKQTWEPIFFYRRKDSEKQVRVGGAEWGDGLNDFDCHVAAVPQTNFKGQDMKQHPAQKPVSVFRWLINATTKPGELVCDPFAGSGTSGIAACQLKRRWHGIESDNDYLKLAERRIATYGGEIQSEMIATSDGLAA